MQQRSRWSGASCNCYRFALTRISGVRACLLHISFSCKILRLLWAQKTQDLSALREKGVRAFLWVSALRGFAYLHRRFNSSCSRPRASSLRPVSTSAMRCRHKGRARLSTQRKCLQSRKTFHWQHLGLHVAAELPGHRGADTRLCIAQIIKT